MRNALLALDPKTAIFPIMTKNILITGGAGFIGSTFVAQSAARGDNIVVLDALTYAGHKENIAQIKGITLVEGNICNGPLVSELLEKHAIDTVVNFAAESHVDNSINASAIFIETNINGTHQLLEASRRYWQELQGAKKEAFRFLHVSTDEVYGSLELDTPEKFTEKSPYQPNSPYSASKAAADHLARAWFETYGLPTIVTNCSNNYGPRQFPEKLIPHMIACALAGKPLPVYGDGKNIRDWIHVEDHCQGIHLAVTRGTPGQTYCFGGREEHANLDLVETLCTTLDQLQPRTDGASYKKQITFVADRPGHDRRYAINDSKAEQELGFSRNYNFDSGLKATIEWYLANSAWCEAVTRKAA